MSTSSFRRLIVPRCHMPAGSSPGVRFRVCRVRVELWGELIVPCNWVSTGVRLMPGLCCVLRGLTRILCTFLQDRSFAALPVVTCKLVELRDG